MGRLSDEQLWVAGELVRRSGVVDGTYGMTNARPAASCTDVMMYINAPGKDHKFTTRWLLADLLKPQTARADVRLAAALRDLLLASSWRPYEGPMGGLRIQNKPGRLLFNVAGRGVVG